MSGQNDAMTALEANLKARYDACEDCAATPSSILLSVLNAVADANRQAAEALAATSDGANGNEPAAVVGITAAKRPYGVPPVNWLETTDAKTIRPGTPLYLAPVATISGCDELFTALDRMDNLIDPECGLLTVGPDSATVAGCRADLALIRRRVVTSEKSPIEPNTDALAIGVIAAIGNNAHWLREVAGLTAAAEQMEAVSAVVDELIETLLDYQQWNPMNCSRDADLHEQAHAILIRAQGAKS